MPTNTDGQSKPTFGLYVEGKTSVLLQTCIAEASNSSNPGEIQSQRVRLILDTGSQKTYITEQLKEALDLKHIGRETLCIKTFGSECNKIQTVDVVKLCLKGVDNDQHMYISAHVVPMICSPLSYQAVQYAREHYPHLSDLTLSDECYDENLEVHVLIGSDNYWNIVSGQTRRGEGGPVAVNTRFGWTVSGPIHYVSSCDSDSVNLAATHVLRAETQVCNSIEDQGLDQRLETFWQLESIGIKPDENPVLETFNKSITFKQNGMYEVKLPWKEVHDPLPDNFSLSLTRLNSLLQRLKTNPERLKEYDRVIKEQLTRGMIERVKQNDTVSSKIHYLPHHCVVREDKQTTKLRIVYNASAKEDGPSLNECLYSGPSLTPDILDILIRFRLRPIALVADIEKAFLMISVEENDRDVLRFLWVDDPFGSNPKVIPYRFTRVVFGVTSSPFLLNATLHKHINEYLLEDPPFVREMLRSLYVDDLTTSLKDVETAYQFYNKARQRLAQGGFNLRKWLSNSPKLMQGIKASEPREQEGATETTQQLSEEDETYNRVKVGGLEERDANTEQKILGINWNFTNDQIHFKFQAHVEKAKGLRPTKRNILKVIAGFYDPMGILSPIIVQMKMLLQEICKAKYSWDAELNEGLKVKWMKLLSELEEVQSIQVPRLVTMQTDEDQVVFELHGFCDASNSTYAAVVYMLSKSTYEVQAQLIASKTRIAPLKTLTIPRLELLGALILSRLISRIKNTLSQDVSVSKVCCWTDSMNVLYWIQGKNKEWKQFVNSRVAEIRKLTCAEMWNHVPGVENPADLASRGVDPSLLVNYPLWWHGPSWLTSKDDGQQQCTGLETYEPTTECLKEMKVKAQRELEESSALFAASTVKVRLSNIIRCEDYGNIFKLYKVTAYVIRFVRILKAKTRKLNISELKTGTLSPEELNASELLWLKEAQSSMEASKKFNQQCIQLGVTSDENGLLRCKGRLANSPLQMDSKFPILLPNGHHITRLIIQDSHAKVMHNGVRETLNELRSRFWLIRGRQTIRAMIHGCQICRRYEGRAYKTEPLSNVPEFRFKEGYPFAATGVDFAGPLFVKSVGGRDSQNMKVYICLFTCGTTRATHLELVPNLSTPAFIRCLRRFIGRRGTPELLISDNAKTFKAAANQIRNIFKDPVTTDFLARRNIQWRFNLEKAPWWGGSLKGWLNAPNAV